jgi:dihydropyrimidinase
MNDEVYQSKSPERYILQPPLRNFDQQGTLEFYLNSPMIHVIATDHCDYTLAQKKTVNNFTKTPGGLPGLETSLQITFSQLYGQMGIAAMCIVTQKMSETPAKIFGLYPRKGTLQIGSDADIVIYDPRPTKTITQKDLHNIAGYTPYEGLKAKGYVRTTISRGKILVHDGKFLGEVGRGQFLAGDEILSELTSQMNPKWIRELKNSSKEMPFNIFMAGHDDDKDDDYFGLHDEY